MSDPEVTAGAMRFLAELRELTAPTPLPLPANARAITFGTALVLPPTGQPLYAVLTQEGGWFGYNGSLSFTATSSLPFNLGIYGPNPTQIGPPFGRMRAPKINMPDAITAECQGNFTSGVYYLCFRIGDNGAPTVPISVSVAQGWWNVFG
jgi:hypothetical protein